MITKLKRLFLKKWMIPLKLLKMVFINKIIFNSNYIKNLHVYYDFDFFTLQKLCHYNYFLSIIIMMSHIKDKFIKNAENDIKEEYLK